MDWVQLVLTGGVSLAILVFIAVFVERRVWPFVTKQIEASQQERKEEHQAWNQERQMTATQISVALQQINANLAANTQATQALAQSIQRMEAEAKRARGTRQ